MALVTPETMTAKEFLQLPEGPPYYELIHGELIMSPSPDSYHQSISLEIALPISNYLKKNPIGRLYYAPLDVVFDQDNVVQPDILFIRKERLDIVQKQALGAPDLIVEILSPGTKARDLGVKRELYARSGVQEYWIVDPRKQVVNVYYPRENAALPRFTKCRGEDFISPLFPKLVIRTEEIFGG